MYNTILETSAIWQVGNNRTLKHGYFQQLYHGYRSHV